MYKSIGIYVGADKDLELVPNLLKFFKDNNILNVHLFTDIDLNKYLDIANLSSFYMNFCPYSIAFTNVADFLQYQYDIVSKNIYVLTSLDEIQKYHLDKNKLSNVTVLTMKDGKIYAI